MKPSEVIREARNQLFERGWHQGGYEGPDGSVCMAGAVNAALTGRPRLLASESNATFALIDAVRAPLEAASDGHVPHFNDTEGRTFDEVIEAFDRAEKFAEQAEALEA